MEMCWGRRGSGKIEDGRWKQVKVYEVTGDIVEVVSSR